MAGRRTFRLLTSSQSSGIKSLKPILPTGLVIDGWKVMDDILSTKELILHPVVSLARDLQ